MAKIVRAVAGILQQGDCVFMASRPIGKVHALSWEFPGGKLEHTETAAEALVRELKEEIGVDAKLADCSFLTFITQSYAHADVELYVMRVTQWQGEPVAKEGQEIHWHDLTLKCEKEPLLITTQKILNILVGHNAR
jgi:8-oxo-dGTP diphosphatase